MKIHVLTPLHRVHLVPTLIHYLEPMNIEWYTIMDPDERVRWQNEIPKKLSEKKWIHPVYVNKLKPTDHCGIKFNNFFDTQEININDYYSFMCDDNMYEPGFFDVIRKQTAKILICSLFRGHRRPKGGAHGSKILRVRNHSEIKLGKIDYAQYIIKGEVAEKYRFPSLGCADGRYINTICKAHQEDVVFLPDLYVFFNYFEPGRYDPNTKKGGVMFVKKHWEYPVIINTQG